MTHTLQQYYAGATQKAVDALLKAYLNLPEDKRDWSPDDKARTALDQVAECALLNGYTADLIKTHVWPTSGYEAFLAEKAKLNESWELLTETLDTNTARLTATILLVSDDDLDTEITIPWGMRTTLDMIAYPYWNLTYHEGQINYIASILGVLK